MQSPRHLLGISKIRRNFMAFCLGWEILRNIGPSEILFIVRPFKGLAMHPVSKTHTHTHTADKLLFSLQKSASTR